MVTAQSLPCCSNNTCSTFILCIWERRGGVGWWDGVGRGVPSSWQVRRLCVTEESNIWPNIWAQGRWPADKPDPPSHTLPLSLSLSLAFIQSAYYSLLYTKPINLSCCHVSSRVLTTLSYIQNQLTHLVVMFHPECLLLFPIYKTN
jgi:hypothetical protein